jgi:transcription elongation factor GreA
VTPSPIVARRIAPAGRTQPVRAAGASSRSTRSTPAAHRGAIPEPVHLSKEAYDRVVAELEEVTGAKRREVVARIKSARELGDLKENADYQAAREEQSFLEGRVLALEDRLRRAVVVEEAVSGRVMIGSTVTVETGGEELTYTIVGTTEANPAAGRLSSASPVGSALLGATPGADVNVRTPRGEVRYRVVSVA